MSVARTEVLAAAIAAAGGGGPRVWLRQGVIVAVAADGTATVTVGGSSVEISGVPVAAHVCPVPQVACWLVADGRDLMVWAVLPPAGPAFGTMRQSAAQTVATSTWTDLVYGSRTEVEERGITAGTGGWTVAVPGVYQVAATVGLGGTWTTGTAYAAITVDGTAAAYGSGMPTPTWSAFTMRVAASAIVRCTIGTVIGARCYQSAGADRSTSVSAGHGVLSAVWVGP